MSSDPSDPKAQVAFSLKTRKALTENAAAADDQKKQDDRIDESELLNDEDKKTKTAMKLDCASRKRACKNCICGRAEVEAQLIREGKMSADADADWQPPAGGCGSCSKGDQFRCATCPFRGTPAWTETKNNNTGAVQLNLANDLDG